MSTLAMKFRSNALTILIFATLRTIPNSYLEKAALWAAFSLLTNTELFDDCTIALDVFLLEIVEQATTLTYQRG